MADEAERRYWVRTGQGLVWGPYPRAALDRLRGRLDARCELSLDGREYRAIAQFPDLAGLIAAAPVAPVPPPPLPPQGRATPQPLGRVTPQQVMKLASKKEEPPPPPPQPEPLALPEQGDLEVVSPVRLYALAADTAASGWLQLHTPDGRLLQISFKRGTPDHLSSDDPELGVLPFLVNRRALAPEQAARAQEHCARTGMDATSALFQLQLIPPADVHRVAGEHALHLLDHALALRRGTFSFERDAPSPPGAYPLGSKWGLLAEACRRLDGPSIRARLQRKLPRRVLRSGGNAVGKLEQLGLNAQEARVWAAVDGTRSGEDLLRTVPDQLIALRLLNLLIELGHASFETGAESSDPPPARSAAAAPPPTAPKPSPVAPPPAPKPAARATPPGSTPVAAPPKPVAPPPKPAPAATPARPAVAPPAPAASASPPAPARAPLPAAEQLRALQATWERLEKADHFTALGIKRGSATADARRAFFQLAREYHPDTVMDDAPPEMRHLKQSLFSRINEAANVLGDEAKRKAYEQELDGEAATVDVGNIFAAEDAFKKAELVIRARRFAEGLALIDEAIKLHAGEGEFHAWRGWALFMVAKDRRAAHKEAVALCKKALQMTPRCAPAWLFQGQMAKILGELKDAEKAFRKVLELEEDNIEAQRELRYLYPAKR